MKEKTKGFISGILVSLLVLSLAIPAMAAVYDKVITAQYRDVKVTLDGKEIVPKDVQGRPVEPFLSNGTTYLPIRGIASTLGLDVDWDGENRTVELKRNRDGGNIRTVDELLALTGSRVWAIPRDSWDADADAYIPGKFLITFLGDQRFYGYWDNETAESACRGYFSVTDGILDLSYDTDYGDSVYNDMYKISNVNGNLSLEYYHGDGFLVDELPVGSTTAYTKDKEWTAYDLCSVVDQRFNYFENEFYK